MPWSPKSITAAARESVARSICRARSACTCSTISAVARSFEFEALLAHECTEIGTLRNRILPGLVFRPPVILTLPELLDLALGFVRLYGVAPPVIGRDLFPEAGFVVAVMVNRD